MVILHHFLHEYFESHGICSRYAPSYCICLYLDSKLFSTGFYPSFWISLGFSKAHATCLHLNQFVRSVVTIQIPLSVIPPKLYVLLGVGEYAIICWYNSSGIGVWKGKHVLKHWYFYGKPLWIIFYLWVNVKYDVKDEISSLKRIWFRSLIVFVFSSYHLTKLWSCDLLQ